MKRYRRGVTNFVWKVDDCTVVKYFSPRRWTITVMNMFKTFFLDFEYFSESGSMEREIEAKQKLERIGVDAPRIKNRATDSLEMEYIPGENLREVLEKSEEEACHEIGIKKGEQLRKIHMFDYALIDSRLSNNILNDEKIYSIDHELFTEHPSRAHKEFDLISLETSARFLEPSKYRAFIQGVKDGYGEKFGRHSFIRMFLTLCTGIGFSIFGERSSKSFFNGFRNWMEDIIGKIL